MIVYGVSISQLYVLHIIIACIINNVKYVLSTYKSVYQVYV